jgi:WD40 repeat protein
LQTGQIKHTLEGHLDQVTFLAISLDGQILASCSKDCTIKVWDLQTGQIKHTLEGHLDQVTFLAISPDGQILASCSKGCTIKANSGRLLLLYSAPMVRLLLVALTRLSKCGIGRRDSFVNTLQGHSGWVNCIAIAQDGLTLISGSEDNTIKLWNLQTGQLKRSFKGHFGLVRAIAISPDGQKIISGSGDKTIKVRELPRGRVSRTFHGHSDHVTSIAVSLDGKIFVSPSSDKTIKLWGVR